MTMQSKIAAHLCIAALAWLPIGFAGIAFAAPFWTVFVLFLLPPLFLIAGLLFALCLIKVPLQLLGKYDNSFF